MKNLYLSVFSLMLMLQGFNPSNISAQTGAQYLDVNNVSVPVAPGRLIMFWDDSLKSNYSYPKDDPKSLIFASSLWLGAKHNDSLYLSAQMYGQRGNDFHAGPLDVHTAFSDSVSNVKYNRIWKINRAEIEYFKDNFNKPGYQIPNIIKNWPANGTGNHSRYLAKFIDVNNDGIYEPSKGDYPKIYGDQMLYRVVNDRTVSSQYGAGRESGGAPLGVEIHGYAYAFQCNDTMSDTAEILNTTTFYHFEVINRSTRDYDSLVLGVFLDADLGNFIDDYSGCYIQHNLGFTYNGDDDDEGMGGFGKNENRLACGTQFLSHTMDYYMHFQNSASPIYGNPRNAKMFYNYLQSKYGNGIDLTVEDSNGNLVNSDFNWAVPFDSITPGQKDWLKNGIPTGSNITPSDRRYVQSTYIGDFKPGEILPFDYAVVLGELAHDSKIALTKIAPMVKNWYEKEQYPSCLDFDQLLSSKDVNPLDDDGVLVYPNPARNSFNIKVSSAYANGTATLFNSVGVKVGTYVLDGDLVKVSAQNLAKGIYIVRVKLGDRVTNTKVLVGN